MIYLFRQIAIIADNLIVRWKIITKYCMMFFGGVLMKSVVIFGADGHGKVVADILEKQNEYSILGFLDGSKESGSTFFDYKVLGNEKFLIDNDICSCVVAVGDNWIRHKIVNKIISINPNVEFVNAIHP